MVLIMTVEPGFGGQGFIPECMDKIRTVRAEIQKHGYPCELEIDGGAKLNNTVDIVAAGADVIVAGSAVFGGDIAANVKGFHQPLQRGQPKQLGRNNPAEPENTGGFYSARIFLLTKRTDRGILKTEIKKVLKSKDKKEGR